MSDETYEIAADDMALDAIGHGAVRDDPVLAVLAGLRAELDEVAEPPALAPPTPLRRKAFRRIAAAGVAASVVALGAVVTTANRPGELLYSAHRAILGPAVDRTGRVVALLDQAAAAARAGDARTARSLVRQARPLLPAVVDGTRRAALRARADAIEAALVPPVTSPASPRPHVSEPGEDQHGSESPGPAESTSGHDDGHDTADPAATPHPSEDGHGGDDHATPPSPSEHADDGGVESG